jgi:hypothetical protein
MLLDQEPLVYREVRRNTERHDFAHSVTRGSFGFVGWCPWGSGPFVGWLTEGNVMSISTAVEVVIAEETIERREMLAVAGFLAGPAAVPVSVTPPIFDSSPHGAMRRS